MAESEKPREFNHLEHYAFSLPENSAIVSSFIERLVQENPGAEIKIEKFTDNIGERRVDAEGVNLSIFIAALKQSQPFGASVRRENIYGYQSKDGKDKSALEFSVRGVQIDGTEHIIWIKIPDTPENRVKIKTIAEEATKKTAP